MSAITERIVARMRYLGLEEIDLAAGVRVAQSTVNRWTHHYSDPRAVSVPALAKTLSVSVNWLLTGEEEVFDEATRASMWEGLQGAWDKLAALQRRKMTDAVRAEIEEAQQAIAVTQQLLGLTASEAAALAEAAAASAEAEALQADAPDEDDPSPGEDEPPPRPSA